MRTWLYIDGNHLQHAAFRGTELAPLNPVALVEQAFPNNGIHCAKFFATPWSKTDFTPEQVAAQRRYWSLLRSLANFYLIEGRFRRRVLPGSEGFRVEERGSDVNLTAHLLSDLMLGCFDAAIVVTGNPDYVGTGIFSEAFVDRFAVRFMDWGYDAAVERKLVKSRSLLKMANDLRARKDDIETPVSTRLLTEFEDVVEAFGWDFAFDNLLDRFADSEEREAVRGVFNTYSDNVKIDLGLKEKPVESTKDESTTSTSGMADWERDLLNAPWDTK